MFKSSYELLVDLENPKHEQGQVLASMDVVSIFTNVAVYETIELISKIKPTDKQLCRDRH